MPALDRSRLFYLMVSALVVGYISYRAIAVGITYDEAWTIRVFVPLDWEALLRYEPASANHHLLNTLLVKFLLLIGPDAIWWVRLPNVLAGVLYTYMAYRISDRYLERPWSVWGFLVLLANPFLLDFFSLARGYGLSLGFMLASIYGLLRYAEAQRLKQAIGALAWGSLAVWSSFTLLTYWLLMVLVLYGLALMASWKQFRSILLTSVASGGILALTIARPIQILREEGLLYYGGDVDFHTDTLMSLAKYLVYQPFFTPAIRVGLNLFLVLFGLVVIGSFYYKQHQQGPKWIALALTLGAVAAVMVQHYALGTLYVIDRAALYFYPLIGLSFVLSLNDWPRWLGLLLGGLCVGGLVFNLAWQANGYKTALWYFDAHSQMVLEQLEAQGQAQTTVYQLDYSWPFSASIEHYHKRGDYPHVTLVKNWRERDALNPQATTYLYLDAALEKVNYHPSTQAVQAVGRDTLRVWEAERVYLLELRQ